MALSFESKIRPVAGQASFASKAKPITPTQPAQPGTFKYPVQESSLQRKNKIAQYQQEASQAEAESKKANSLWGMTKNFGKAFGSTIASAEVGLGQSIAKIANVDSASTRGLQEAQASDENMKVLLMKQIRKAESEGRDATRLKQAYNAHVNSSSRQEVDRLLNDTQTLPTTGQVVGQIGGTALDLLTAGTYGRAAQGMSVGRLAPSASSLVQKTAVSTGLPEISKLASQKASGLLTKKGLGNMIKGAGIGYASDVTQGLQGARGEDRTGAGAFVPGLGTAFGVSIPAISETTQSVKNQFTQTGRNLRTTNKRVGVLDTLERDNKMVRTALETAKRKGVDVKKVLTTTDLLNGAVDSNGTISTKDALANFDEVMAPFEGEVRKTIVDEGATVNLRTLADRMQKGLTDSRLSGGARNTLQNNLDNELKGLATQADRSGNIPLTAIHDSKVFIGSHQNYTDTGANAINKDVTRILKEIVEENTKTLDVDAYNKGLSERYALRDVLEALNGKKVEGGRLGKHFTSLVGGVAGSYFGPLGAIAGAETGRGLRGAQLRGALGGNLSEELTATPEMLDALSKKGSLTPQEKIPTVVMPKAQTGDINLRTANPAQSKNVGNLKITQATTIAPTKKAISETIPPKAPKSTKGLGIAGMLDTAKANLKDPKMRQGGYIANPLGKAGAKSVPVSLPKNSTDTLVVEAKKYKSAEEFVKAGMYSPSRDSVARNEIRKLIAEVTETRRANTLKENPNNPPIDKSTVNIRAEDIREGKRPYVVVDGDMIIDGHHTYQAYLKEGVTDIPVITKSQLTDIWKKANEKATPATPKLPAEVKSNIVKIIDDYRLNKGKDLELQEDASRIAEDMGITMPKNYGVLVGKLQKLLDENN